MEPGPQASKKAKMEEDSKTGNEELSTLGFIKDVYEREGITTLEKEGYFSPFINSIRSHYIKQGKFQEFVRFIVDIGILARKTDRQFLAALKKKGDTVPVLYGESSLAILNRDTHEKTFTYIPKKIYFKSYEKRSATDKKYFHCHENASLEYLTRYLRTKSKYRVCYVPRAVGAYELSAYPFAIELIYALAEDLNQDEELFSKVVDIYIKSITRHSDGSFVGVYGIEDVAIPYLKKKGVKLVYAVGQYSAYKACGEEYLHRELRRILEFPCFAERLESPENFIVVRTRRYDEDNVSDREQNYSEDDSSEDEDGASRADSGKREEGDGDKKASE